MTSESFETRVLVDLEYIKGAIKLVDQKVDTQGKVQERHEEEIKLLKEQVARNKGRDAILSYLVPILVSVIVSITVAFFRG